MIHYICKYTPIELFAGFGAECIRREPLVSGFELADGASHQNLCALAVHCWRTACKTARGN